MVEAPTLMRPPLYPVHVARGGYMGSFAGWEMPLRYKDEKGRGGDIAEHQAVRERAGLFDISHMFGEELTGPGVIPFVNYLTINDVRRLEDGQAQYSAMCNESGGIVDDIVVYRFSADHIQIWGNAVNRGKNLAWIMEYRSGFAVDEPKDLGYETVSVALQGPKSAEVLAKLTDLQLDQIGRYRFAVGKVAGLDMVVSRTGYTGEDGFELCFDVPENVSEAEKIAEEIWKSLLVAGEEYGILPCGLSARDTLRLEAGYCLYGHEINETTNPLEAGLERVVKFDKGDFIGRDALWTIKNEGLKRRLIGFQIDGMGPVPRKGHQIFHHGELVGLVTSGGVAHSINVRNARIGLGYLPLDLTAAGTRLEVVDTERKRAIEVKVVELPFYSHKI